MGGGLSIETEEVGKVPVVWCVSVSVGEAGAEGICEAVSRCCIERVEDKFGRAGKGS